MKAIGKTKSRAGRLGLAALLLLGACALFCAGYGSVTFSGGMPESVAQAQSTSDVLGDVTKSVEPGYDKDGINKSYREQIATMRRTAKLGETFSIDSEKTRVSFCKGDDGRMYDWTGTMQFTVLSADIYDSLADAPVDKRHVNGFVSRGIANDYAKEGGYFVTCKVKVSNVDAKLGVRSGKAGYTLASAFELSGSRVAGTGENQAVGAMDMVYLNCECAGAVDSEKPEYVRIAKGASETFTIGWCVLPGKDEAVVDRLNFDLEGLRACDISDAANHRSADRG